MAKTSLILDIDILRQTNVYSKVIGLPNFFLNLWNGRSDFLYAFRRYSRDGNYWCCGTIFSKEFTPSPLPHALIFMKGSFRLSFANSLASQRYLHQFVGQNSGSSQIHLGLHSSFKRRRMVLQGRRRHVNSTSQLNWYLISNLYFLMTIM